MIFDLPSRCRADKPVKGFLIAFDGARTPREEGGGMADDGIGRAACCGGC